MIIDTCIFAGELEMLEFRMKILDPVVDHFVVVQNRWTHQGQPRELVKLNVSEKIHSWAFDIQGGAPREIEINHRNAIAIACLNFKDDDMVILSDVDEIPSRESVAMMREVEMPRDCPLDFYYYRLNWKRPEKCSLIMSTIKHLRQVGGEEFRSLRGSFPSIGTEPSGWHLSYFGGTEAIQKKLTSFCHPEFNRPEFLDKDWLEECQWEGKGLLKCGTKFLKSNPDDFPQYFLDAAPTDWWL